MIISNDIDGVYAQSSSYPDLGTYSSSSPGNNKIYGNTGYEVKNYNSGSTFIQAKYNWWGSSGGPSDGDFYGYVRYLPPLYNEPCLASVIDQSPFKIQLDYSPTYLASRDFQWHANSHYMNSSVPLIAMFSPLMANQMQDSPEDYIDLAIELYANGKLNAAKNVFEQVLTYFPDTEAARYSLQQVLTIMEDLGQSDQILSYLAEVSSKNRENSLGWNADLIRSFILGNAGKYEEALKLIESVLQESKVEPEFAHSAELYRAMILSYGLNRKEDAIQAFTDFLASNPSEDIAIFAEIELETITGIQRTLPKRSVGQSFVDELADEFKLFENHPNPFNSETVIRYILPSDSKVTLGIYDLLGREIRVLVNSHQVSGYKEIIWDGKDSYGNPVSSGMYLYNIKIISLESNMSFSQTRKMVLLR